MATFEMRRHAVAELANAPAGRGDDEIVRRERAFEVGGHLDAIRHADPREVARVVDAPVAAFLPDAEITVMERDVREWRIRYGAYALPELGDGPAVWGATARILGQLGAVLGG